MSKFNEDTRVKIPATIQFLRLGYNYQSLRDADIDFQTKIFKNRLKPALERINGRAFSYDEITEILVEINHVIKNNDMGKEFYNWLINPLDKVKLIDFEDFTNNDFAIVDELPFTVTAGTEEVAAVAGTAESGEARKYSGSQRQLCQYKLYLHH